MYMAKIDTQNSCLSMKNLPHYNTCMWCTYDTEIRTYIVPPTHAAVLECAGGWWNLNFRAPNGELNR